MNPATIRLAIYARVSSDQQAQENTIASQVDALRQKDTHCINGRKSFAFTKFRITASESPDPRCSRLASWEERT